MFQEVFYIFTHNAISLGIGFMFMGAGIWMLSEAALRVKALIGGKGYEQISNYRISDSDDVRIADVSVCGCGEKH